MWTMALVSSTLSSHLSAGAQQAAKGGQSADASVWYIGIVLLRIGDQCLKPQNYTAC